MRNPSKRQRAAIEAVAQHFSATLEGWSRDGAAARLSMDGERVAAEVAALRQLPVARGAATEPRLRFDRVALRLVRDLQAGLRESVPEGRTLAITITAPIRQASRTAAVLADEIRGRLTRRTARLDLNETIHGNRIRVRLVEDVSRRASKVVGFVHNPDPAHPDILLDLTALLLRRLGTAPGKRVSKRAAADRWLVLPCDAGLSHFKTCRHVLSQLAMTTDYQKVLLVSAAGRVETLAG